MQGAAVPTPARLSEIRAGQGRIDDCELAGASWGRGRPPTSGGEDREVGRTPRGRGHRGEPVPAEPRRSQAVLRRAPELVAAPTRGATRRVVPDPRRMARAESWPSRFRASLPTVGPASSQRSWRLPGRWKGVLSATSSGAASTGWNGRPRTSSVCSAKGHAARPFHGRSRHCPSASMASRKRSRSCRRRQPRRHRVHLRHCSITRTGAATQSPRQVSAACPCMP